jgi:hypothetical protein
MARDGREGKSFDSMGAVWASGECWLLLVKLLLTTFVAERRLVSAVTFKTKVGGPEAMRRGTALGRGAWDCSRAVFVYSPFTTMGAIGLTPRRVKERACGEQAGSSWFPLRTERAACLTPTRSALGSAGAARGEGECLATLIMFLLTAVLCSCLSSVLKLILSPSGNGEGPKGHGWMQGERLDSMGAVLSVDERRTTLELPILLAVG